MRKDFGAIIQATVVGNVHDAERDRKIKEGKWDELDGLKQDTKKEGEN